MGYSKLGRNSDQRKALIRDLITDLIINESIETTLSRSKELRKLADKMITLGKKGDLAARRKAAELVRFEKAVELNDDGEVVKEQYAIKKLFEEPYDFIIDACDTMIVKKLLIKYCNEKNINLITVCGMGKKLNPNLVEIIPLSKTNYDPIAKQLRKYVKDEKINSKVMCICSKEQPNNTNKTTIASMSMVPATAGILAAYYVINSIISK